MAWILDLDGVVWLSEQPIPGSAEAIAALRDAGHRVMFLTNNAGPRVAELVDQAGGDGRAGQPDEVVTSAQAAASLLEPGSTALLCAGPGVREALEARGVKVVREGDADAVVVGFHRDFDYDRLTAAFLAVHHGARLVGTNDDTTYPTPDGPIPGGGAILAAVAAAAGVEPEVAGKPYAPMAALLAERLELVDERGATAAATRSSSATARRPTGSWPAAWGALRPGAERGDGGGGRVDDDPPEYVVADLATLSWPSSWARLRSRRRPRGRW